MKRVLRAALAAIVGILLGVNFVFAAVIVQQTDKSEIRTMSTTATAGVHQMIGTGLSSTLGSVTFWGDYTSGSGVMSFFLKSCASPDPETCIGSAATIIADVQQTMPFNTPGYITFDLRSYGVTFDPTKYYLMDIGFNPSSDIYGTTRMPASGLGLTCRIAFVYGPCESLGSLYFIVDTTATPTVTTLPFFDDFNRPDGAVGNGWSNTTGNVSGNLVIRSLALSTPGPNGRAGIYRPIDLAAPVTMSATLTQANGAGGLLNRYESGFLLGTNGNLSSGYEVLFSRSDQTFASSSVLLELNGSVIDSRASTFQFGAAITPTVTFNPIDGSIKGSVAGDGNTFNFDFGPHTVPIPGPNIGIDLEFPDPSISLNPTIDNLSLSAQPTTLGEQAAALAKTLLGAAYGYGGKGYDYKVNSYVAAPGIFGGYRYYVFDCETEANLGLILAKGVDCSGLVMWSYNTAFGATTQFTNHNPITYPTANGQYLNNATTEVSDEVALKAGDLLFFNYEHGIDPLTGKPKAADHVAMYVGGDDVLEAYTCNPKYPTGNSVIRSSKSTRATHDPITGQVLPKCADNPKVSCFVDFRRVDAPVVKLTIATRSPVSLAVTDPDGFAINADTLTFTNREVLRETADVLYYIEDTNSDDTVISPVLKTGAYLIKVFPKPGTHSTDNYSLVVEAAGKTITLAQNVLVQNIPSEGYGVASTGSDIAAFIPVAIDIKPGGTPNSINSTSHGKIPVAILSTATFNAPGRIAPASLTFGRSGNESSLLFCNQVPEDVNGDGLPDLVCHFDTTKTGFRTGDTQGIIKGQTLEGIPVIGTDSVRIVH